jgi:hypothetical protein
MSSLLMTDYFRDDVLAKRTYIRLEWCQAAITAPVRKESAAGRRTDSPLDICARAGQIFEGGYAGRWCNLAQRFS